MENLKKLTDFFQLKNISNEETNKVYINGGKPTIFKNTFVSWNSGGGGRAEGKILRVIENGSFKVPNTGFTIKATYDDPAAVIRLYRNGIPTNTIVAHKLNSLY